jgi:AcrR family transcriptional regulator
MMNVWSPEDDRTARARIRDEALRLFGERGPDAVTIRTIASAAGVSPALVVRHYGSKDGLREAVDAYVSAVFEAMLAEVVSPSATTAFDQDRVPTLAEMVAARFSADTAIPAYLGRLLMADGPAGSALFRRLYDVSLNALTQMTATGLAREAPDPPVRVAVLLVNDLAVLILRERLREVLGVDPLSATGMRRWGAEVMSIYQDGIGPAGQS